MVAIEVLCHGDVSSTLGLCVMVTWQAHFVDWAGIVLYAAVRYLRWGHHGMAESKAESGKTL